MLTGRARTKEEFEALKANGSTVLYRFDWAPPPELPSGEFPFELNTGRLDYKWHTRTKTGRAPMLHLASPEAYIEINPSEDNRCSTERGHSYPSSLWNTY
ncbi:hypothetical protein M3226_20490 [Neobacillus cucumis]|uniref:hypothetical protein n=1 Tax=Neobacillus cucumis TaxID=1740721 RepID=UPI00203FEFE6|nr:hypothetical protein [Neobacillus cucumis]MCM3728030.1 hypothetical protein [Neobacillus cucumis]